MTFNNWLVNKMNEGPLPMDNDEGASLRPRGLIGKGSALPIEPQGKVGWDEPLTKPEDSLRHEEAMEAIENILLDHGPLLRKPQYNEVMMRLKQAHQLMASMWNWQHKDQAKSWLLKQNQRRKYGV